MRVAYLILAMLGLGASAQAQELAPRLNLHGFGGWAYGRTDKNVYLTGDPAGNYRQGSFALNFSAHLSTELSIIGQTFWRQENEGTETEIDYAFAEWKFSDALKLRVGKVKQPFGIYTEVFDVGTLRPFLSLPQSIYGPVGLTAEGYQGIGLRGVRNFGGNWGLDYDLYGGGIRIEEYVAPTGFLKGDSLVGEGTVNESTRDLLGTRLVLSLPVPGLRLGGSAYTGTKAEAGKSFRHSVIGAQVEYLSDHLWLRGEYAYERESGLESQRGGYGEAAWFLTRQWQLAARYERMVTHFDGVDPSPAPSLLKHREFAAGLNFWVAPEFVLKGSVHAIRGNRLAGPQAEDLAATIAAGTLQERTRLVQVGAQFSF